MLKYIIIVLYVIMLAVIGMISVKRTKDMAAFLLGGRKAGAWMSAFAYGTTYFSAVIFIGYAGRNGWSFGLWAVLIGLGNAIIGSMLAWLVLAKRTRDFTQRFKLSTMPEFFAARYDSNGMKIFAAVIIFIFMTPYSASVYTGLSYLFEKIFNIPYFWGILLMAVVSAAYLVLGGYVATLIADFVQGIIMLGGIAIMVGIIMGNPAVGGFLDGTRSLINQAAQVPLLDNTQPNNIINLLALILLTSVGSWGLPQMIHKFYAIKDDKAIKRGTVISTAFCTIIGCGAYFTGAVAKLYYTVNSSSVPMENGKIAFDRIIPDFLSSTLPDALLGIIIILVLSASVTTLTGIVLASSSSLVIDLIKPKCKNLSDKKTLLTTRIFCMVFIIVSVIIAMTKSPIQTLMSFSWGTISGAFLAPYALGLYWKGVTKAGAWSGLAGGAFISVVLALVFQFNASQAPLFGVIAMIGSLVFTVGVSLVTKKYSQAHINHVFEESAEKAA